MVQYKHAVCKPAIRQYLCSSLERGPPQMPQVSDAGWQDLLKVITVSCIKYISCIRHYVRCILRTVYRIQHTYCIQIELYTFSTYVRMAPPRHAPRHEQQQHVRVYAFHGQGCHHLMLVR
jgi:hypothetical protein